MYVLFAILVVPELAYNHASNPSFGTKKHKKSVLYLMNDYNFSFFRNVYLEFFIQGLYQHLTELGQLN